MPRFFSIITLVITLAFVSVFFGQIDGMASDPGLGWHLKTGSLLSSTLEIPRVDPFLAPALKLNPFDAPLSARGWVCDQWLGDLILHHIFTLGGWPLLYALVIGVFLFAFWGVSCDALLRRGTTALAVVIAGILAWKAAQVHMIVRPVVFSVLFFAVLLRIVHSLEGMNEWRLVKKWREYLGLCSLFIVWANTHPAFVLGLGVLAAWCIVEIFRCERNSAARKSSVLVAVACGVGTLINPQGIELHRSIVSLGVSDYFMSLNQEWHPLSLESFEGRLLIALVAFSLLGIVRALWKRSTVDVLDIVVAVVLVVLTLRSVRYAPFAALSLLPLAALGLHGLRDVSLPRALSLTKRVLVSLQRWEGLRAPNALLISGALACSGVVLALIAPRILFWGALGPVDDPSRSVVFEALEKVWSEGRNGVVLASPNLGGAITYQLWPRYRAVIDDRNTLVGEKLYRSYFASLEDSAQFELMVQVFGVTDVIISPQASVLNQLLLRPQWTILYRDERSVLLHRE